MKSAEYGQILAAHLLSKILKNILPLQVVLRKSKTGAVSKISPEVLAGIYDIDDIKNLGKFSELVVEFKNIFDEKLTHCNNRGLYDRLETISIVSGQLAEEDTMGDYDPKINKITIDENKINKKQAIEKRKILFHELVHMATTHKKGIITTTGFQQGIADNYLIGRGLNEGYTDLITERYFCRTKADSDDLHYAYPEEQIIAYGIEMLVGQENMEKLFFNADLDGLLKEMIKYMSIEEAHYLLANANDASEEQNKDTTANVKALLANKNMSYQTSLYKQGKITKEEYEYQLLRIDLYTRGYILSKKNQNYEIGPLFVEWPVTLSKEAYRVLQNEYKNTKNYGKPYDKTELQARAGPSIVTTIMQISIAERFDNVDMSQVERLELIDIIENKYKITPRISTEINSSSTEIKDEKESHSAESNLSKLTSAK